MLPSLSVSDNPNFFISFATGTDVSVKFVIMERKAVPELDALIPAFAINPNANAVSSALNFNAPATGATYLNDSPNIATLVFALDDAAAKTSAKRPLSSAFIPNAVSASVTMSDTRAKPSPDAAA